MCYIFLYCMVLKHRTQTSFIYIYIYIHIHIHTHTHKEPLLSCTINTVIRSRWLCNLRRRSEALLFQGLRVRIPLRALMFIPCVYCVGSGPCDELINRIGEYYRECRPRPRTRWADVVQRDALQLLRIRGWRRRAENRDEWRRLMREAKARKGLQRHIWMAL